MRNYLSYNIVSLMSGTSLDGLDLVKCNFKKNKTWSFSISKSKTIKYSQFWEKKLNEAHLYNNDEIEKISCQYGCFLANKIKEFSDLKNIDLITSHGHTIFHQPKKKITLQIGCGQTIANQTNIKTVTNFRTSDVLLGGQGAPLVPVGDLKLFRKYKYCLNLGGFANISIKKNNQIFAFDICPVNIVLNYLSKRKNKKFDKNGHFGMKGKIIPEILIKLNNINYYKLLAPKSLSREWLEINILPLLETKYNTEDLLHTFYEHIANMISKELVDGNCLITGGGTHNEYLIKKIKDYSKSEIIIPKKNIIDFKEAIIFGFLGLLRIENEINCLKTVTGASRDSCSGEVFTANFN